MGLIDFLEGAYRGGRLLFLLYDHDKQVKLRHKAMKGRGVKRLSSTTDNITRLREITPVNRPLVSHYHSLVENRLPDIITPGYANFGEIGHMVGKASESLLRAAKLRRQHQELARKEYHFLTENLEMETSTRKNKQWFLDRIGKTIYRNPNGCSCRTCKDLKDMGAHGLTITDRLHALYLYDIQCEYEAEGITLNYRDEK